MHSNNSTMIELLPVIYDFIKKNSDSLSKYPSLQVYAKMPRCVRLTFLFIIQILEARKALVYKHL